MSRPMYETQTDRDNEERLSALLQAEFNCQMTKMPIKYSLDYMATRGGVAVAFIEMKSRKNDMWAYPTYMVSLHKAMRSKELERRTGLPCFLAVQWRDAVGICKLPPDDFTIRMGGSARRNDAQDMEPMAYFGISEFRVIHRKSGERA